MRKDFHIKDKVVATLVKEGDSYNLEVGAKGSSITGVKYKVLVPTVEPRELRFNEVEDEGEVYRMHVTVRGDTLLVETFEGDVYLQNGDRSTIFNNASIYDIVTSERGDLNYFIIRDRDAGNFSISQDGGEVFRSTFSEYLSTGVQLDDYSEETLLCFRTLGKEAYIVNVDKGLLRPVYNKDISDEVRLVDVLGSIYFPEETEEEGIF